MSTKLSLCLPCVKPGHRRTLPRWRRSRCHRLPPTTSRRRSLLGRRFQNLPVLQQSLSQRGIGQVLHCDLLVHRQSGGGGGIGATHRVPRSPASRIRKPINYPRQSPAKPPGGRKLGQPPFGGPRPVPIGVTTTRLSPYYFNRASVPKPRRKRSRGNSPNPAELGRKRGFTRLYGFRLSLLTSAHYPV